MTTNMSRIGIKGRMVGEHGGIKKGDRVRLRRGQTEKVGRVLSIWEDASGPVLVHVVWEKRAKRQHMSAWVALGNLRPVNGEGDDNAHS